MIIKISKKDLNGDYQELCMIEFQQLDPKINHFHGDSVDLINLC